MTYDICARKREESNNLWPASLMAKQECSPLIISTPLFFFLPLMPIGQIVTGTIFLNHTVYGPKKKNKRNKT